MKKDCRNLFIIDIRSKTMKKNCNCEKIDKGFELDYWKLSYRRKFIRTLWLIPLGIIAVMLV